MTEYINIDAAIEAVAYRLAINKDDYERAERQAVDWLPEAEEDVVKVVRCKDCKNRVDSQLTDCKEPNFCMRLACYANDNNFCSFGERLEV